MSETIERKRRAKRQTIFDAAARRFAMHGYHAARMADIADDMGLQKAALYYYFDSKEAILVGLIRSRIGVALESLRGITETEESPPQRITRAVTTHLRVFQEHADLYTIYNSERLHQISRDTAAVADDLGRQYEQEWARMIDQGVAGGDFASDLDVPITVKAIMGMLNTTLAWFDDQGRLSVDQLAEKYARLVLRMLSA